ncbi:MAG: hypothetical protein WCH11_02370 [Bdellovibrio sp.]
MKIRLVDPSNPGKISLSLVKDMDSNPQSMKQAEILKGHVDFFVGSHFGYWREGFVYQILTGSPMLLEVRDGNDYDSKGQLFRMAIPGKKFESLIENNPLNEKMLITSDEKYFHLLRIRVDAREREFFFDTFALEKPKGTLAHPSLPVLGQNTAIFVPLSSKNTLEEKLHLLHYELPYFDPSRQTIYKVKPTRIEFQGGVDAWHVDSISRSFAIESSRSVYRFNFSSSNL